MHGLRWRIALPYVLLIVVTMLGLTLYVSNQVRQVRLADLEAGLTADARLLTDSVASSLNQSPEALDAQVRHWSDLLQVRVTLIDLEGNVLGESHEDRTQMDNHLTRHEVQQALAPGSGQGSSTRYSSTVGYEMMYVAAVIKNAATGQPTGVVRVALSLREIETGVNRLRRNILLAGLLATGVAVLLALLIAERAARPVRLLTQAANRMAQGEPNALPLPSRRDEVGQLSEAFRQMAQQIQAKLSTLAAEQGRLAAVLDHMADGVLITDELGEVQLVNAALVRLLGTTEEQALGRSYAQVVTHYQLIDLWRRCRERQEEQAETIEITRPPLFLQAIVTPFKVSTERGYLVILQDLTRIRRLETVRRDFISNISHELRTPLAGIRALVDTLQGGALHDLPAAQRFLSRMSSEVDALTQMVEELLELSRIESGKVPLRFVPTSVADIVLPPLERLRPQAEEAELDVDVVIADDLPAVLADPERARQVVTNLVHNAIKFTLPGGKISVRANRTAEDVLICVQDSGVGIASEDLPRIFERFYKADQARSGGGTGLGLAIAKHIIQVHGGRIWADSREGHGSTFTFTLPAVNELLTYP